MLPLTFITGLFGMNVGIEGGSVLGMSKVLAFAAVCVALAAIAWLEYAFFVRRRLVTPMRRRKKPRRERARPAASEDRGQPTSSP
jgi:hypothetical protein